MKKIQTYDFLTVQLLFFCYSLYNKRKGKKQRGYTVDEESLFQVGPSSFPAAIWSGLVPLNLPVFKFMFWESCITNGCNIINFYSVLVNIRPMQDIYYSKKVSRKEFSTNNPRMQWDIKDADTRCLLLTGRKAISC